MAKKISANHSKEQDKEMLDEEELNQDIYEDETREDLEENDEIQPWEEGFMEGAAKAGQLGKDALDGKPLKARGVTEVKINNQLYRFNSETNAKKFKEKAQKIKK